MDPGHLPAQGLPSGRGQWVEGPAEPGAPLGQCSTRLFLLAFSGRHHLDCWSGNGGGRLWVPWGSYSFLAAPVPYLSLVTVPPGPAWSCPPARLPVWAQPALSGGLSVISVVPCGGASCRSQWPVRVLFPEPQIPFLTPSGTLRPETSTGEAGREEKPSQARLGFCFDFALRRAVWWHRTV